MCFVDYEDDDNGYDDNGYEDDGYGDDNGYDDYDNGYEDDYGTETEPTDTDYNVDYGAGASGEIETNTNTTLTCSTCFIPQPVFCSWSSGSGLRFPSFIRHYEPPARIISFGPWGSLTNRYNRWGATGRGRWQGRGGSRWNGNYGNQWQSNSWLSGNSCLWAGGLGCGGGGQVEIVPRPGLSGCAGVSGSTCTGCGNGCAGSSNNLFGWMGRFTNQKQTGRRPNSNNYWSNSNIRWGQRGGGGRGGFSLGGLNLGRFTNQWSSMGSRQRQQSSWNNRWGAMRMGSGSNKNNWSGSSILKSWFG